jgi:hypothetical protein
VGGPPPTEPTDVVAVGGEVVVDRPSGDVVVVARVVAVVGLVGPVVDEEPTVVDDAGRVVTVVGVAREVDVGALEMMKLSFGLSPSSAWPSALSVLVAAVDGVVLTCSHRAPNPRKSTAMTAVERRTAMRAEIGACSPAITEAGLFIGWSPVRRGRPGW